MNEDKLPEALEKAAGEFVLVLEIDIDYYDKLFAEWDAKRIGEREFQEVFLGRDGVHAYAGRQAQIWARRRKLGMGNDVEGGSLLGFPTYLVYPRGFIRDLDDEAKKEYLGCRIPNPDVAHYFDTEYLRFVFRFRCLKSPVCFSFCQN